ncbi:MAG: ATP-binding cassette domain-containing protein [Thaumarchaeota archaeon]|nr:ATP-binding cassette domain-containing protein [Nitrososphaerota archaeon]
MDAVEVVNLTKEFKIYETEGQYMWFSGYEDNRFPLFKLYLFLLSLAKRRSEKIIRAIDNLTFSVKKGQIFGVLGPNGSGKTTLLKLLSGLTMPSSGHATVFGLDIVKDHDKLPQILIYMPGLSVVSIFSDQNLSIRENLLRFCEIARSKKEKVDEIIATLELETFSNRPLYELSTGILSRFAFAFGLIRETQLFLMDEPLTGISPEVRANILTFIKEKLNKKYGATILYATHRLEEAQYLCDYVMFLDQGRILSSGSPYELIKLLNLKERIDIEIALSSDFYKMIKEVNNLDKVVSIHNYSYDAEHGVAKFQVVVDNSREIMTSLLNKLSEFGKLLYVKVREPTLEDIYFLLIKGKEAEAKTEFGFEINSQVMKCGRGFTI